MRELFEVVTCQTHVPSCLPLINTFAEYGSCVSMQVLIKLDCHKVIFANELANIWNFNVHTLAWKYFLWNVLNYSSDSQLCGILWHICIWWYFYEIHFSNWNVTSCANGRVWAKTKSKLLMVEYCWFERQPFDKVLLDEEDRDSWPKISLLFVGDSLHKAQCTVNLTSGGVKVKMPNLGILIPRPILKLRLMYNPMAFHINRISSSLKVPYTLKILT